MEVKQRHSGGVVKMKMGVKLSVVYGSWSGGMGYLRRGKWIGGQRCGSGECAILKQFYYN